MRWRVNGGALDRARVRVMLWPMHRFITALFFALPCGPAFAACPPVPHDPAVLAPLLDAVRKAPSEAVARELSGELWKIWTKAPDAVAQEMLNTGMRQRESYDFAGAVLTFDKLVAYCPDYAEGYNQRAFARFLQQDFDRALVDLDATLELAPYHHGALSGRALALMGLGRMEEAQAQLRAALELNPWLPERRYLLTPPSDDL